MYADLGHFGVRPIRISWFAVVFPSLLQLSWSRCVSAWRRFGRRCRSESRTAAFARAPRHACNAGNCRRLAGADLGRLFSRFPGCRPRAVSSAERTPHASGAFRTNLHSLRQAPYAGCVALVLGFRSSAGLAAAYGLAVAGVMVITSAAMFSVARRYWEWSVTQTALVWGLFDRGQRRAASREFAEIPRRRLHSAGNWRCELRRHGDVALGAQGDLRSL